MFENFLQLPTISDVIALGGAAVACYGWWRERRGPKTVIEIEYVPIHYEQTFPNRFFLILKVVPGHAGISIHSISLASSALKEVHSLSLRKPSFDSLSPSGELSDEPCKVHWEVPSASEYAGPWFSVFLCKHSDLSTTSRIALTIRQECSLCFSITKLINHHAAIRLRTPNNETIASPTIRIEL